MTIHIAKTRKGILIPEQEWNEIVRELKDKIDISISSDKPEKGARTLLGLGKEIWQGIDPVHYQRQERDTW